MIQSEVKADWDRRVPPGNHNSIQFGTLETEQRRESELRNRFQGIHVLDRLEILKVFSSQSPERKWVDLVALRGTEIAFGAKIIAIAGDQ